MTKKWMTGMCMTAAIACCVSGGAQASEAVSGTFTGEGSGKSGTIRVEVTLEDSKLSDIQVTESHETGIIDHAYDILKEEMLAGNTVNVYSFTGATLTSSGFKMAVSKALDEAGVKLEASPVQEHEAQQVEETYDVVVIGAGGAGLLPALCPPANGAGPGVTD